MKKTTMYGWHLYVDLSRAYVHALFNFMLNFALLIHFIKKMKTDKKTEMINQQKIIQIIMPMYDHIRFFNQCVLKSSSVKFKSSHCCNGADTDSISSFFPTQIQKLIITMITIRVPVKSLPTIHCESIQKQSKQEKL